MFCAIRASSPGMSRPVKVSPPRWDRGTEFGGFDPLDFFRHHSSLQHSMTVMDQRLALNEERLVEPIDLTRIGPGHPNNTLFFWAFEKEHGSLTAPANDKIEKPWGIWLNGG